MRHDANREKRRSTFLSANTHDSGVMLHNKSILSCQERVLLSLFLYKVYCTYSYLFFFRDGGGGLKF